MKRQFTLLAKYYDDSLRKSVAGYWFSEKLDGQRAIWDGGISRGLTKKDIPWANKENNAKLYQICTGLWSRLGNIIHAPKYWLDALPKFPLDGELYNKSLSRQYIRAVTSRQKPITYQWEKINYHIFDQPNNTFIQGGEIDIPNCYIRIENVFNWVKHFPEPETVRRVYSNWEGMSFPSFVKVVEQYEILPKTSLEFELTHVVSVGGEGLMIRNPSSIWRPYRTNDLLKVKKPKKGEGITRGWQPGKGKFKGMMGSLEIMWNDRTFEISGFTDEERRIDELDKGCLVHFKYLQPVKFKYNGLTDDGIPIEARYSRPEGEK